MNVLDRLTKDARVAVSRHRDGELIRRRTVSSVEAEDAAAALRKERVVRQENRKAGRRDAADQLLKLHLEVGDADFTNLRTGTGYRMSKELRHGKGYGGIDLRRILQQHMVILRHVRNRSPEIGTLESVHVLRVAHEGTAWAKAARLEDW